MLPHINLLDNKHNNYRTHVEPIPIIRSCDPDNLVTILNPEDTHAHIEENEKKLLALGPAFAVSPTINDKTIRDVELNLAQCSYKLKFYLYLKVIKVETL